MKQAIYPGTFDPVTLGHLDVMRRAAGVFDRLVVAVAVSSRKNTWFGIEERMAIAREAVAELPNVSVTSFDGLLVEFARKQGIHCLVRGLRAFSDFEYEFQMALTNRKLAADIETVFLMTSEDHSYISSTTVREVWKLGGDTRDFVPSCVQRMLDQRRREQG